MRIMQSEAIPLKERIASQRRLLFAFSTLANLSLFAIAAGIFAWANGVVVWPKASIAILAGGTGLLVSAIVRPQLKAKLNGLIGAREPGSPQ